MKPESTGAFREVWVAYLLGGLYLLLGLYTEISEQNYSVLYDAQQKWNFVQQNIYSYGATLTAFLLAGRIATAGLL